MVPGRRSSLDLNSAFIDLQRSFSTLGLRLNALKSFLFSTHDIPILRDLSSLATLQLIPFSSSLTVLGSPVGTVQEERKVTKKRRKEERKEKEGFMEDLMDG